jgi:basic membrane protein A
MQTLHEDLIEAIHTAVNPTVRDDLMAELRSVRERIVELTGSTVGLDPLPAEDGGATSQGAWPDEARSAPTGGGALVPVSVPGYDPDSEEKRTTPLLGRQLVPLGLAVVAGLGLLSFALFGGGSDSDEPEPELAQPVAEAPDPAGASASGAAVTAVRSALTGMGFEDVTAEVRDGVVVLSGSVSDEASRNQIVASAQAVSGGVAVDATALVLEVPVTQNVAVGGLQRELDRLLGATPITFASGEVTLSDRHQRILNNVVPALLDNPGLTVEIIGYTDGLGAEEVNLRLSQSRAQNVVAYLQSQGVPAAQLQSRAAGESASTGSADLQSLERRVELRVVDTAPAAAAAPDELSIALIAPSAANDLASTQSMTDALNALIESDTITLPASLVVEENVVDNATAERLMTEQAEAGARLIVAHGVQFGPAVAATARNYPSVAFAWGAASDTFGLPNVYPYNAAAEEGGYVLGSLAARLSESATLGFVGPLEVGDAVRFANGFRQGAENGRPGTTVRVDYTGSFSEIALAAESARAHLAAGADTLTGSAPLTVGAIDAAAQADAIWLGNEADQSPLAPANVAASQVYDWSVVLGQIVADLENGQPNGRPLTIDLANGGLSVVFNPSFPLDPVLRSDAEALAADVAAGVINPQG